jgi:hypothetical protein
MFTLPFAVAGGKDKETAKAGWFSRRGLTGAGCRYNVRSASKAVCICSSSLVPWARGRRGNHSCRQPAVAGTTIWFRTFPNAFRVACVGTPRVVEAQVRTAPRSVGGQPVPQQANRPSLGIQLWSATQSFVQTEDECWKRHAERLAKSSQFDHIKAALSALALADK